MFKSFYKLSIEGKDVKRFIRFLYKRGVFFNKISYDNNIYYIIVDKENYNKINAIKTTYIVKITRVYGPLFLAVTIKKNAFFIITFLISLIFLFVLCNIVFDVVIVTDDLKLKEYLFDELKDNNIKKFTLIKNYDERSNIKNKILDNNRDKLEWLEIENVGVKYIVRLDKRIIKEKNFVFFTAKCILFNPTFINIGFLYAMPPEDRTQQSGAYNIMNICHCIEMFSS